MAGRNHVTVRSSLPPPPLPPAPLWCIDPDKPRDFIFHHGDYHIYVVLDFHRIFHPSRQFIAQYQLACYLFHFNMIELTSLMAVTVDFNLT